MTSSARFYFQDIKTGAELSDHPLNGSACAGAGPWVQHEGHMIPDHRTSIEVQIGRTFRKVTTADFGGRCVRVKMWAPNPDCRETFVLVPDGWVPRPAKR